MTELIKKVVKEVKRFFCECRNPTRVRDMGDHFICEDCGGEIAEYE